MPEAEPVPQVVERIEVTGVVQGVGFRPFVHRLATRAGLRGEARNTGSGVAITVAGPVAVIDEFVRRLGEEAPPLAAIDRLHRTPVVGGGVPADGFVIADSDASSGDGATRTLIPPDTAVCDDCVRELREPTDRRHGHPFITCTNCGPRFTIITGLPYDRPNTTMAGFAMCRACAAEYHDPTSRRHHAQPVACHDCGPSLTHVGADGERRGDDAIARARADLVAGRIVAIKGLGGFHLACDAADPAAVDRLRERKHRPDRPFAVMVPDLGAARRLAVIDPAEATELGSPARPIVLLRAGGDGPVAPGVAPGNPLLGVMLAYTPVHHLLFDGLDTALVMTSANLAGEPIVFRDDDLERLLGSLADTALTHDRPIVVPCDDSVVRVMGDTLLPIRRARGFAPIPIPMPGAPRPVLATGGELKNTFCLASSEHAWVSQHIGDMGTLATLEAFESGVDRFVTMCAVTPERVVADDHPGYLVSRWARRHHPERVETVQHHHAHVAAVMAEHELPPSDPVLGFAFDGTGYGTDGAIWGGEVLVADASGFDRVAHLAPVPHAGGDAAVADPCRMALAHLHAAGIPWGDDLPCVAAVEPLERERLARQLTAGVGCVATTSMGRLFDAVASLLGLRHHITYEAQAAIELEHLAAGNAGPGRSYELVVEGDRIDPAPMMRAIVADLRLGVRAGAIADGFHDAVVDAIHALAVRHRQRTTAGVVALSGGVFQNALLTVRVIDALSTSGFDVRTHRVVPPNDGGLALGQAYIAAHRDMPGDTREDG